MRNYGAKGQVKNGDYLSLGTYNTEKRFGFLKPNRVRYNSKLGIQVSLLIS
jgi:hypothetical protein